MYKQTLNPFTKEIANQVIRLSDNACIPFAPDNTDYQTFKKEVLAGAELQSADGVAMTQEQADAFIATLP
jgi:hypothetical protein